jgi:transcription antitermination factor NusG
VSYWAVARTLTLCEQQVCRRLERLGFETYIPKVEVERRSQENRLYKRAEPLFHAYVFVKLILQWHEVRRTEGVTQLVMSGEAPGQIDDAIVDELKARAGPDGLIRLPRRGILAFRRGDRIRVRGGPLTGRAGIFEGMRSHERVAVLLSMLGAPQRVELPAHHVEAVDDQDEHNLRG